MKRVLLLLLVVQFFVSAGYGQVATTDQNTWKTLDSVLRNNWDGQLAKSPQLPQIYISCWPGLPFMFYWDSYFINEGLMLHGFRQVAKWNTENLLSVVDKYGYAGNASVTAWGMNRSQPPYLSAMVRRVFEASGGTDTAFLRRAYPTLKKEYRFWTDTSAAAIEQHNTPVAGLQRFYHHATREELLELFKELSRRFRLDTTISEDARIRLATPYAVEAATGMDFTTRFEHRCSDFIAVELNSLLYVYEQNFAWMKTLLHLQDEPDWEALAARRKTLVNQYCWDEERGLYIDYDFVNKRRSKVAAATSFQPLWAGLASPEQAAKVVRNASSLLLTPFGLATVEKTGEIKNYQWGETSLWAPMQFIAVAGMDRYGFKKEARALATSYLRLINRNFLSPQPAAYKEGPQKFVARAGGKTYEKYKTDGTINDDEYPASVMMGWTAAVFAWCYNYVSHDSKKN